MVLAQKFSQELNKKLGELGKNTLLETRMGVANLSPFPIFDLNFFGQMVMFINFCRYARITNSKIKNLLLITKNFEDTIPCGIDREKWITIQKAIAKVIGVDIEFVDKKDANLSLKKINDIFGSGNTILKTMFMGDNELALKLLELLESKSLSQLARLVVELNIHSRFAIKNDKKRNAMFRNAAEKAFFIAVSEQVKETYNSLIQSNRVEVIRNGVDPYTYHLFSEEDIRDALYRIGVDKGKKVVSFVGRPDCYKGWDFVSYILRKFEEQKRSDVVFLFAFSPTRTSIKKSSNIVDRVDRVNKLFTELEFMTENGLLKVVVDVSKYFYYHPELLSMLKDISKEDIEKAKNEVLEALKAENAEGKNAEGNKFLLSPWYAGPIFIPLQAIADILLHTSIHEAYGLSVREASMCGAYIIASNVGALPSLVNSENGKLVDLPEKVIEQRTTLSITDIEDIGKLFLDELNKAIEMNIKRELIYRNSNPENDNYLDTYIRTLEFLNRVCENEA